MSRFVSNAKKKELELINEELRKAYLAHEEGQNEAIHDWESVAGDGIEEW